MPPWIWATASKIKTNSEAVQLADSERTPRPNATMSTPRGPARPGHFVVQVGIEARIFGYVPQPVVLPQNGASQTFSPLDPAPPHPARSDPDWTLPHSLSVHVRISLGPFRNPPTYSKMELGGRPVPRFVPRLFHERFPRLRSRT